MSRNKILQENPQESFICTSCEKGVSPLKFGGRHRNHCPHCLSSLHVDISPGDRRSSCRGLMEPIGVSIQKNKECSIIHRCTKCRTIRMNRVAADDNELMLFTLSTKALLSLPFPATSLLETLYQLSIERGGEDVC